MAARLHFNNFKWLRPWIDLVKAGITGWAQIHGLRGDTDLRKRIEYDLYYIENWSLFLDLKIIPLTAAESFLPKKTIAK
jgi:putative colanic acid biosynthesis UDP-glucose lipid carrier transferase